MLDICITCGRPFVDHEDTRYYVEHLMAKQTFWSPAEYDTVGPYCGTCHDALPALAARDEEQRSLQGLSDEEMERI